MYLSAADLFLCPFVRLLYYFSAGSADAVDALLKPCTSCPQLFLSPQAGSFNSVDFCEPPRGILTLDEDVMISKNTRPDGDGGAGWLVIQGGGQRWKLSSEVPGEILRWEEVRIHLYMYLCEFIQRLDLRSWSCCSYIF